MLRVTLTPKNLVISCEFGESLYDAAARQGVRFPVSCRNGICEICKGRLIRGEIKIGAGSDLLSAAPDSTPDVMLCRAIPHGDCEIEISNVYARGELPLKTTVCQVKGLRLLEGHIYRVSLLLPAGRLPEFYAGQYLSLQLPGKQDASYFSIASAPGTRALELHIQADPHLETASEIVDYLQSSSTVEVTLPFGKACLVDTPKKPLIMIAAGTGFAQMKSMLELLLPHEFDQPVSLYWGVRREQDMYMRDQAEAWAKTYDNFSFYPQVADVETVDGIGHHNQLAEAVLANQHDLKNSLVFVSGSPRLVFSALDLLEQEGLPEEQFFSDVLEYAERPS